MLVFTWTMQALRKQRHFESSVEVLTLLTVLFPSFYDTQFYCKSPSKRLFMPTGTPYQILEVFKKLGAEDYYRSTYTFYCFFILFFFDWIWSKISRVWSCFVSTESRFCSNLFISTLSVQLEKWIIFPSNSNILHPQPS